MQGACTPLNFTETAKKCIPFRLHGGNGHERLLEIYIYFKKRPDSNEKRLNWYAFTKEKKKKKIYLEYFLKCLKQEERDEHDTGQ